MEEPNVDQMAKSLDLYVKWIGKSPKPRISIVRLDILTKGIPTSRDWCPINYIIF